MLKKSKQIEEDIQQIKKALEKLSEKSSAPDVQEDVKVQGLINYLIQERERTNKTLSAVTEKLKKMEEQLNSLDGEVEESEMSYQIAPASNKEVPLSDVETKIINFVQTKEMACADDVRNFMNYKGRNAACARLNRLHEKGLLDRFQLGHKVYYKFDAGKTTNTLIISPPQ